jgi:F-type H+-transporting ATPase subunit a
VSRRNQIIVIAIVLIAIGFVLPRYFPFGAEAVASSVTLPPELMFVVSLPFTLPIVGSAVPITNTLITAWIVIIFLTLFAYFSTRKMSLVPGGLQNVMEAIVEAILGLAESVAGERARMFFTLVATIFIYALFSNLIGLIPGFGPIGTITLEQGQAPPVGIYTIGDAPAFAQNPPETGVPILAPFVRAPSTDINYPLAFALIAMAMVEFWGMQALGVLGYWEKFFNFRRLGKFIGGLFRGKVVVGDLAFGFIDIFIGLVELVSEAGKIIAFTFRLFGNIFAGEVVLLIMSFLFLMLPLVFYGLELFVGVIQAFVFAILTLAFATIATTPHAGEAEH